MNEAWDAGREAGRPAPLAEAMRQVRNDLADRDDVVVELREAYRTRLELVAAELADVIADVPEDHQVFDFAISSGSQPRLWIDAVAHVGLARDRRTYRFVRDTRAGRVVMAESAEIKPIVDTVTRYVAERIVERQRNLDAPVQTLSAAPDGESAAPAPETRSSGAEFLSSLALFAMGSIVGAVVVLALLRDRVPELQNLLQ